MRPTLAISILCLFAPLIISVSQQGNAKQIEAGAADQQKLIAIDIPSFDLDFVLDCANRAYTNFCNEAKALSSPSTEKKRSNAWRYYPRGGDRPSLFLLILLFVDPHNADLYLKGEGNQPDLKFTVSPSTFNGSLSFQSQAGEIHLLAVDAKPDEVLTDGKLGTFEHWQNVTVIVESLGTSDELAHQLEPLKLRKFKMKAENSGSFSYAGPFERSQVIKVPASRFVLPSLDR